MDTKFPLPSEVWERTPDEAQAYIRALEARVAGLEALVQRLQATVQQLTERVQQDSRISSRPPSSDPPQATEKRARREPSGRQPGGQPGHEGQARAVVPIEQVDVVIPIKPEQCPCCQHPLDGEDLQPQRHQVSEIPPVRPVLTEYQLHRLVCPGCGEATRAAVPAGVPSGGFGPRVQAVAALCTGAYHLSKRTTQSVLEDLFGLWLSLGTIANLEQATLQAVAEPVAEARAYVQTQPQAYLDETGWREGRQRAWLWTAVTASVPVFVVRRSRSGQVAREPHMAKASFTRVGNSPSSRGLAAKPYSCAASHVPSPSTSVGSQPAAINLFSEDRSCRASNSRNRAATKNPVAARYFISKPSYMIY